MGRLLLPALLLAASAPSFFFPSLARADAVSDAKDIFTRGRELRAHGDCAGAAGLFRKAYELYPAGLGSLRNLAECQEQIGHFASARRAWLDLKRALLTNEDRKYDGWSQDAEQAAARLAPKLATLTIDVATAGGSPAPVGLAGKGVRVTLDGETLAPELLGTPLDRDPGRHVVRVAGDRVKEPQEQAVVLAAGDARRIALRVTLIPQQSAAEAPAPQAPEQPAPPADDEAERARATKRTAAWIALGAGAASLVGAGISLGVRQSALDTLSSQCPSHAACSPSLEGTVSQGKTASTLVTVLGVVGAVGLTSGIVLLATSAGHGQPAQARLVVTPGLGGASATWSFR